jgi:hypothetical protein
MLALYRSGRQAEALRVYADTRRRLVDELGLEPGQALQQLEQAILRHDNSLALVPAESGVRARPRHRLVAAIALSLAAAAAAAGVLLARGGPQSPRAEALEQPNSVALIAERTDRVLGHVPLQTPLLSSLGAGALWTVSADGELYKIDQSRGRSSSLNTVPRPCGLAVGEARFG